jgi:hypothetical protein
MNALDRLLRDELSRMLDRVAAAALSVNREGAPYDGGILGGIEAAEARLTALRLRMLEDYERWAEALGECGNLWALALLEAAEPSAAEELRAA